MNAMRARELKGGDEVVVRCEGINGVPIERVGMVVAQEWGPSELGHVAVRHPDGGIVYIEAHISQLSKRYGEATG